MKNSAKERKVKRKKQITFFTQIFAFVHKLVVGADIQNIDQHLCDLFTDERKAPGKYIHKIGQPVGVRRAIKLSVTRVKREEAKNQITDCYDNRKNERDDHAMIIDFKVSTLYDMGRT